jgi:streptogramin lyase
MHIQQLSQVARRVALTCVVAAGLAVPAGASAAEPTTCAELPAGACRAEPFFPSDSPVPAARLGSPGAPEDDLAQALSDLAATTSTTTATIARGRALAILEGDARALAAGDETFLDRKAYRGIPLLNWNLPRKVKTVPAGTAAQRVVDVTEVRFGDHAILDTWMLRFDAPDQPFQIRWHITELGTSFGGELSPAGVPGTGAAKHALVTPLVSRSLLTGTTAHSRFHPVDPAVQQNGAAEETRVATKDLTVDMPAPNTLTTILDPNLKPGHETFAQIAMDEGGRLARAQEVFGFDGATEPTVDQKDAAIAKLAPLSGERQIWDAVKALDPGNITAANSVGSATRQIAGAMRSRDTLPVPDAADPAADLNVQLANGEAYTAKRQLRVAPDTSPNGTVTVAVRNLDTFAHTFSVRQLRGHRPDLGVLNWGSFDTNALDLDPGAAKSVTVAANETVKVTVTPAADAFSLWIGDADLGDQGGTAIALDRGPRTQSLVLGQGPAAPLHEALDHTGKLWVTLPASDELVRLSPTDAALTQGEPERFPLPGGISDPAHLPADGTAPPALFEPGDVAVDGHGIVWATLAVGNGIARIDPAKVVKGTPAGIDIITLAPCDAGCRKPPAPVVPGPLSRLPLQMRVLEDGGGNTVVFFTEQMADRIGVVRFAPDGRKLNEAHLSCGCLQPLGIALDPEGRVWFTEGSNNRLGRLTLDQTRPFSGTSHTIEHYNVPSSVTETIPGEPLCPLPGETTCLPPNLPNPQKTSLPHSVTVDRKNRVWFTEEATEKVAYLDLANARPGTSQGFHEAPGPINDFKRALAPADVAVDRAGTAFFSDEYGDQVASATVRADGSIDARTAFRPAARNSLTDSPLIDPDGNLWYIEGGANLITRVSRVNAGLPLPARTPLITADTTAGKISATAGMREMSSVDLRLWRGATMVTQVSAAVADGGFSASLPIAADDRVEIVPQGTNAPAPFSFRVAGLTAAVSAGGTVTGRAVVDGRALADDVSIEAGTTTATTAITATDGSFSWNGGLSPASGARTVAWTAGGASARFRTVTSFGTAAAPGGGTTGGGAAPAGDGATGAVPGVGAVPAPAGQAAAPAAGPAAPSAAAPAGQVKPSIATCSRTRWMARSAGRRTLPLLGLKAADAQDCLGRPGRRTRSGSTERWTYPGTLEVRLSRGRVVGFTLLGRRLRSEPDRATVGESVARFRTALGTLARDGRRSYRGLVAMGAAGYADVRLSVDRSNRVTRVTVSLKTRDALDRTARSLLRSAR